MNTDQGFFVCVTSWDAQLDSTPERQLTTSFLLLLNHIIYYYFK